MMNGRIRNKKGGLKSAFSVIIPRNLFFIL